MHSSIAYPDRPDVVQREYAIALVRAVAPFGSIVASGSVSQRMIFCHSGAISCMASSTTLAHRIAGTIQQQVRVRQYRKLPDLGQC